MNYWNYRCVNWTRVVLSRAHIREGIFLVRPLDSEKEFSFPSILVDVEIIMINEK